MSIPEWQPSRRWKRSKSMTSHSPPEHRLTWVSDFQVLYLAFKESRFQLGLMCRSITQELLLWFPVYAATATSKKMPRPRCGYGCDPVSPQWFSLNRTAFCFDMLGNIKRWPLWTAVASAVSSVSVRCHYWWYFVTTIYLSGSRWTSEGYTKPWCKSTCPKI